MMGSLELADVVGPGRGKLRESAVNAANFVIAAVALVLLAPFLALVALAIKLDSRGPVLYRQVRVGLDRRDLADGRRAGRRGEDRGRSPAAFDGQERRVGRRRGSRRTEDVGGRPFVIYKFRTMHVDAEHATGPVWAAAADSRTTRLGRVLRRYRIDEIPQFLNVLKGEMSVVGPRPERPSFVRQLRGHFRFYGLRQRVRPGITGLAQVSQAADQSLDDVGRKLAFDLEYLRRRCLATDIRIMLKTLPVMLLQAHDAEPESIEGEAGGTEPSD